MTKGRIMIEDLEGTLEILQELSATNNRSYRLRSALERQIEEAIECAKAGTEVDDPKGAWKPLKAGYRDLQWVKDFQNGYVQEEDFDGLEIDMLGNVRFAAGAYPDVDMPKTEWYYGNPELAPKDRNPEEQNPTGRMKFEYGGRSWHFILRKHGLTFFPVVWIVDESFWDTMPVRLFEGGL